MKKVMLFTVVLAIAALAVLVPTTSKTEAIFEGGKPIGSIVQDELL